MARQSKQQTSSEGASNRRSTGAESQPSNATEKKDFLEVFKNRPQDKASYTDPDYEVPPGESDGVHIQAEIRTFDRDGNCQSKPQILKFGDREWDKWYKNRGVSGYSINKILHRPANIASFEVDEWKGPKPEGR